uniref:SPRY domain-containing protein n=2 Tax=Kalanchoe fedtschenkoi TaxID=63787 RepID=A0A7N0ZVR4_KALFE
MLCFLVVDVAPVLLFFKKRKQSNKFETDRVSNSQLVSSLHAQQAAVESGRRRPSLHGGFRRHRSLFSWSDHPSSATDAVETGWPRFAFSLSPSYRPPSILGMCAAGDGGAISALETEISWEIGHGSADFMQKIRLNPGKKRSGSGSGLNPSMLSVIRTALPLPGPACAFPQEAYFEIMILSCREEEDEGESIKMREGEKMKLIVETGGSVHRSIDSNTSAAGGGVGGLLVAVGLTVGGVLPMKIPGSYQGSVGFSSSGSIYHDGNKLVPEFDNVEWGTLTGKVIGCSYVPAQKKVSFTIDSELVHTLHCTTEEFGTPLYPTLAANCDVTVLVNKGQSPFKYTPANAARRINPCFVGSPTGTFCDDSTELFSIGRIDSQWRYRSAARSEACAGSENARVKDCDEESDLGELFEIVLDGAGRASTGVGR